ncbi:putative MFS transporter [Whalleya microplaca]|nr:putative MFS transporter [Whalleya microplaca]
MTRASAEDPEEGIKVSVGEIEHKKEEFITEAAKKRGIDDEQIVLFRQFIGASPDWHRDMTKRVMRKVDFHLLPMLILMYLLNFLDRSNLAQARLGTLEKDLNMTGTDFNLTTSILFVGYLLMQLPSNLLLTRVQPSVYLGVAMAIWGVISAAQAATHTLGALVACRFFLGFAEAPYFPGAIFLMSSWYTRAELAHRIAWFYCGNSLANAFGGLLGAGILGNMSGARGIAGWRWLFIIEGCITVVVAISAAFILPNYPATTKWLTPEERAYAQWRLVNDTGEADLADAASIKDGVMMALKDPRLYLFTLIQHSSLLTQAFQYFFPTILKTLGYGNIESLLLTVPIWAATFIVSLAVTSTSGRFNDRSMHIVALSLLSAAGNIIFVSSFNTGARFFGLFLLPMGSIPAYQIIIAWVSNSFPRPLVKRSACISFANMIGNTSNIYGSYMYPSSDGPRYLAGGAATAGVSVLVAALAIVARLVLQRQNKKLAEREVFESDGQVVNLHAEDREAGAVGFRYIL